MAKILIIEDEPTIQMVLKEILNDEGFEVISALDGFEGLDIINKGLVPDVILVDLKMPRISGREVVLSIRSRSELKNTPIIIISGAVYDPQEFPPEDMYQASFGKPFDLLEIVEKIRELCP